VRKKTEGKTWGVTVANIEIGHGIVSELRQTGSSLGNKLI
jgi:hypothetical protein